jgi:UDP-2-acetamido-3-amino-2,3-dideoxy-glucuronate N-acetyltransferase
MSNFFIHPKAIVDSSAVIGMRSRVWAFAHIADGVTIGDDCNICDHTFLENGVVLGHRVTVKCGVYLWSGVQIEDDVFIGPCVAFSNDLRPRSRKPPERYSPTVLRKGCSIGANATLLPVTVGEWAMIGAAAVVTRDVPAHALMVGNPARKVGWVCSCGERLKTMTEDRLHCTCGLTYQQSQKINIGIELI